MGAYVCPSCGEQLRYREYDLQSGKNWKGVTASCPNEKVCGVQQLTIIIDKTVEDAA